MPKIEEGACIVCGQATTNTACGAQACADHLHSEVAEAVRKAEAAAAAAPEPAE